MAVTYPISVVHLAINICCLISYLESQSTTKVIGCKPVKTIIIRGYLVFLTDTFPSPPDPQEVLGSLHECRDVGAVST